MKCNCIKQLEEKIVAENPEVKEAGFIDYDFFSEKPFMNFEVKINNSKKLETTHIFWNFCAICGAKL